MVTTQSTLGGGRAGGAPRRRLVVLALLAALLLPPAAAWRQYQPWNSSHWCAQVQAPTWPFAYGKGPRTAVPATAWEAKGHSASNAQFMGHTCTLRGAQSTCSICEDIACGTGQACNAQLQGTRWNDLPRNVPTASDGPFAVGPAVMHRHDFGRADRVCMLMSGGNCTLSTPIGSAFNYTAACAVRCWGNGFPTGSSQPQRVAAGSPGVVWSYDVTQAGGGYQGRVTTVAGNPRLAGTGGKAGYRDGPAATARFSHPQGIAAIITGSATGSGSGGVVVYVADTGNHVIRALNTTSGIVTTVAGMPGRAGYNDGPASGARFSSPTGIAVWRPCAFGGGVGCGDVLIVADTHNHRIRAVFTGNGTVVTLAGGGNLSEDEVDRSPAGYADGQGVFARFDGPMGVAVDTLGNVYVADTRNNLIRAISPSGTVTTVAGTLANTPRALPGCPPPCFQGEPGYTDGPARQARFYSPYGIAIGPGNPYTLVVSDGDRVRMVTRTGVAPFLNVAALGGNGSATAGTPADIASLGTVITLAGGLTRGIDDGLGIDARFDIPRGIAATADGRIYVADSARCRIRRITPVPAVASLLTCQARLPHIVRPQGCASHEYEVDSLGRVVSPMFANIRYNSGKVPYPPGAAPPAWTDGRAVPPCVGVSPPINGTHLTGLPRNATGATVTLPYTLDEDTYQQTEHIVACPPGCGADFIAATSVNASSPNATVPVLRGGGGSGVLVYDDESPVCAAAVHAGLLSDAVGGHIVVTALRGSVAVGVPGVVRNGLRSVTISSPPVRAFSLSVLGDPFNTTVVHTVAGVPAAPLERSCGYDDALTPYGAIFSGPTAVASAGNAALTNGTLLYIADTHNHAIRALTATCTQMCENGGRCVGPDTCSCPKGWSGTDCSVPVCSAGCATSRHLCVAPDTCACIPGYTGPLCDRPQCVQTCAHGGFCSAPDTCTCSPGWFDANCTTPVCTQTCGNGGNCTAPDTCSCPAMWRGADCRTPVCTQTCLNGGVCTAPDTCTCPPSWSGHDCSKPVCHQGFFRPDPRPRSFAPSPLRPSSWLHFVPCNFSGWCNATNEFECFQLQRGVVPIALPPLRSYTGLRTPSPVDACFVVEVGGGADTPYRYETEFDNVTRYARHSPLRPYAWGPTPTSHGWSSPFPAAADRQLAVVSYANVTQGVYVCANGGNCTAPDTCVCAPGWIGFDCRTPICTQGFYYPDRLEPRYPGQGSYHVSRRTVSLWENPRTPNDKFLGYVHDHPNFHSKPEDMDARLALPTTHQQVDGLLDDTIEGWRRFGWWVKLELVDWQHGDFELYYNRTCPGDKRKEIDLRVHAVQPVDDPYAAFSPRISYDNFTVTAEGRWVESGGECTDRVLLGCFNSGTCSAPDTCQCATGWEGSDCSLPICHQPVTDITNDREAPLTLIRASGVNFGTPHGEPPLPGDKFVQYRRCPNRGNCTQPDVCTCEKGWSGPNCTIPMCAQECFNGGSCIAPDTCKCSTRPSTIEDKRGLPLFTKPDGDARDTGWTGFDCNTPICVQAEKWVLNDDTGLYPVQLISSTNEGYTFQGGCPGVSRFTPSSRTRVSDFLCGHAIWYEGGYAEPWNNAFGASFYGVGRLQRVNHPNYLPLGNGTVVQGPAVRGEGIYACHNEGSCVAPDTCECDPGWQGYDCDTPRCTFTNAAGYTIDGCRNNGICGGPNTCYCPQTTSLLYQVHAGQPSNALTGYAAPDCTMPICTQGFYDSSCSGVGSALDGPSSAGRGCYRCANGGNCTAPDTCECATGWTGYDCRTPVCRLHATAAIIAELRTVDQARVSEFEADPCRNGLAIGEMGMVKALGNCSRPNVCTCLCWRRVVRDKNGKAVEEPWRSPINRPPPAGFVYGRFDCIEGYEGALNDDGTFASCHLRIYRPTWWELNSLIVLSLIAALLIVLLIIAAVLRYRYMQYLRNKKREARRLKARSLEAHGGAATPSAPPAEEDPQASAPPEDDPKKADPAVAPTTLPAELKIRKRNAFHLG